MEKLIWMLENGWSVHVKPEVKRVDGPNGRDFYIRFTWETKCHNRKLESDWEGFETPEEAVQNMYQSVLMAHEVIEMNKFKINKDAN